MEEHRKIQRQHRAVMKAYRQRVREQKCAAQLVQFMWRRHYSLNANLAAMHKYETARREEAARRVQAAMRSWFSWSRMNAAMANDPSSPKGIMT